MSPPKQAPQRRVSAQMRHAQPRRSSIAPASQPSRMEPRTPPPAGPTAPTHTPARRRRNLSPAKAPDHSGSAQDRWLFRITASGRERRRHPEVIEPLSFARTHLPLKVVRGGRMGDKGRSLLGSDMQLSGPRFQGSRRRGWSEATIYNINIDHATTTTLFHDVISILLQSFTPPSDGSPLGRQTGVRASNDVDRVPLEKPVLVLKERVLHRRRRHPRSRKSAEGNRRCASESSDRSHVVSPGYHGQRDLEYQ